MITSFSNKAVKEIVALNKKASYRRETGLFIAEGVKIFEEMPKRLVEKVFLSESFCKHAEKSIVERVLGFPHELLRDEVFASVSDTKTPQGILIRARQLDYAPEEVWHPKGNREGEKSLLLLLETIQDPGNLGTIIRSAEGAGVSGIVLSEDTADVYNPKVVRSTMGSLYRVPFVYVRDFPDTIKRLGEFGTAVYAASLEASAPYEEFDFTSASAFLIGNEARGLRPETAALARHRLRIPMRGSLESLNAAVASAVLLYEAARQRRQG